MTSLLSSSRLRGPLHAEAPPYTNVVIARHAEEAVVSRYLDNRTLLPIAREAGRIFEEAQVAVRAAQDEVAAGGGGGRGRVSARVTREAARRLLAHQLRELYPHARQCRKCMFGPVDHVACDNLAAHHNREYAARRVRWVRGYGYVRGGTINNACPRCGWFSRDIRKWPRWNGKIPPEAAADADHHPATAMIAGVAKLLLLLFGLKHSFCHLRNVLA